MLDDRKATILRAIVGDYIRAGQPVGSRTLVERYRLRVSSATIRNDMSLLEELGYIVRPHASAGGIPTDQGYRWYVDHWPAAWPALPARQRAAIAGAFASGFAALEEALDSTSHVLARLTEAVAVVAAPPARENLLRRIELLARGSRRAALLLIGDTGTVEQGLVEFDEDRTEEQLSDLARSLNEVLGGRGFEELPSRILGLPGMDEARRRIAAEIERILSRRGWERVFRDGTANILLAEKFADLETAYGVVNALEQPSVLSELLEAARRAGSILVFIGQENPIPGMHACATVLATYEVGPQRRGTLGVVGPTRMDYPHTISAVDAVARSLSGLLAS
jgi:heat-inducible transcriptional repressor